MYVCLTSDPCWKLPGKQHNQSQETDIWDMMQNMMLQHKLQLAFSFFSKISGPILTSNSPE